MVVLSRTVDVSTLPMTRVTGTPAGRTHRQKLATTPGSRQPAVLQEKRMAHATLGRRTPAWPASVTSREPPLKRRPSDLPVPSRTYPMPLLESGEKRGGVSLATRPPREDTETHHRQEHGPPATRELKGPGGRATPGWLPSARPHTSATATGGPSASSSHLSVSHLSFSASHVTSPALY